MTGPDSNSHSPNSEGVRQPLPDPTVGPPPLPSGPQTRVPTGRAADPQADRSVRPTLPEDCATIGRIHSRTLSLALSESAGEDIATAVSIPSDELARQWEQALQVQQPGHHVLSALDGGALVGFAAIAPADALQIEQVDGGVVDDPAVNIPTLEILALEVDPGAGRTGHGSRLLSACTDLATQDGAAAIRTWALQGEEARQRFLKQAGFAPSGLRRTLRVGDTDVVQIGWHVHLTDEDETSAGS